MEIKKLVEMLPKEHIKVLEYLIAHMREILNHRESTQMGIINIAIVFGPTLFRSKDGSPITMLTDSPILAGVIASLIKHRGTIFENLVIDENNEDEDYILTGKMSEKAEMEFPEILNMSDLDKFGQPDVGVYAKRQNSFFERRRRRIKDPKQGVEILENKLLEEIISQEKRPRSIKIQDSRFSIQPISQWRCTYPSDHTLSIEEFLIQTTLEDKLDLSVMNHYEKLAQVEIDLNDPITSIQTRLKIHRGGIEIQDKVSDLTLEQVALEKKHLKNELKMFEFLFAIKHGHAATSDDKISLKTLYERYNELKYYSKKKMEAIDFVPHSRGIQRRNSYKLVHESLNENKEYQDLNARKFELKKKLVAIQQEFQLKYGRKMTPEEKLGFKQDEDLYFKLKQELIELELKSK